MYTALPADQKAFRLLTLKPGKRDDLITGALHLSRLDVNPLPAYETISYCWGDANIRDLIKVGKKLVSVPHSSAAALRRVRLQDRSRIVWIDAICINQEDLDERSSQVRLMGDVFANGVRGLAYFGEDNMVDAFLAVRQLAEDPGTIEVFSKMLATKSVSKAAELLFWPTDRPTFVASYNDIVYQALVRVLDLEWFCRIWTYQEAVLAKDTICFCGSSEITLLNIVRCGCMIYINRDFVDPQAVGPSSLILNMIYYIEPGLQRFRESEELVLAPGYILSVLGRKRCKVESDKIYGMLGLVPALGIIPDYAKPAIEVFMEATRTFMAHDKNLYLLAMACDWSNKAKTSTGSTDDQSPSWVPRLCEPMHAVRITPDSCNACKRRIHNSSGQVAGPTFGILRTSGFIVDHINKLAVDLDAEAWNRRDIHHLAFSFACSLEQFAADTIVSRQSRAGELVLNEFTQGEAELATIIHDQLGLNSNQDRELALRKWRAFKGKSRAGIPPEKPRGRYTAPDTEADTDSGDVEIATQFTRRQFAHFVQNWILASTYSGLLGSVPKAVEVGDVVVILNGFSCPAILRRIGYRYRFIGPSWVYGIMDGETVERHEDAGGVDQIFDLC